MPQNTKLKKYDFLRFSKKSPIYRFKLATIFQIMFLILWKASLNLHCVHIFIWFVMFSWGPVAHCFRVGTYVNFSWFGGNEKIAVLQVVHIADFLSCNVLFEIEAGIIGVICFGLWNYALQRTFDTIRYQRALSQGICINTACDREHRQTRHYRDISAS